MKKLIFLLLGLVFYSLSFAQDLVEQAHKIYNEGFACVVNLDEGDSFLNVKIGSERQIWTTINYADAQKATEIVRVGYEWKVSSRTGEDNTFIAGFNMEGKPLFAIGFPDNRAIYEGEGDQKPIRSTYPQRDIVERGADDYLVTIQKDIIFQIYNYREGFTKYPELVFEGFEEEDLINLSYWNGNLIFENYQDGKYTPYFAKYNNCLWEDPKQLKIDFLDGFHSICIQDSLLAGIKDNQLYIWEIIPDSWLTWEALDNEEQLSSSVSDTSTTEVIFFLWEEDAVEGNLMRKDLFDSLGLVLDENLVIVQSYKEVQRRLGEVSGVTISKKGYLFCEFPFDLVDDPPKSNVDSLTILLADADRILMQIGAYTQESFENHQLQGGFKKVIGTSDPIQQESSGGDGLIKYQIDITELAQYPSQILSLMDEYLLLLQNAAIEDRPFLIISKGNRKTKYYK